MKRLLVLVFCLSLPVLACCQSGTWTVKLGGFPWHDRVNQWALSEIPDRYLSDRPVPQQSCTARSLVVPAGTTRAVIAVVDKQLQELLDKQPGTKATGDKLQIKQGGAALSYAIVEFSRPPAESSYTWLSAGVILLGLEPPLAAAPAPATPATAVPGKGEYVPADKAEPWHDRAGRWVIANLPAQYTGGKPVPQQSCDNKTLLLPPGTAAATVALSDSDLAEFRKRYPQLKDTGLDLSIEPPGGGAGLPYSIVVFPDPPQTADFRAFAKGGIVLLSLSGAGPALPPTQGAKAVLAAEQEVIAQEWPFQPGERKVKFHVEEPPAGITANTGLMLVLHNWGGVYNSPEYLQWSKTFAQRYNVIALSVNYLQSGQNWHEAGPYDHGYLQAMDCLRALHAVYRQLKDKGLAFNEHRVYSMGGSGGGNVTEMVMKLAPHSFACGIDICGMPGLTGAIAYGTGEGTSLNAGYSRDPASPAYLTPDMQQIRDFGDLEHCKLLKAANPNLKIVIVHGVTDASCPVTGKIGQYQNMLRAGLDVDGHFLTDFDVDGTAVTTTGHPVGNREQVVIKYADVYLLPDGKFARATAGPSDFTRGGTWEYPTTGGTFVISFDGPPTVRFEKKK